MSRRTEFTGTAASRRRMRRANLQSSVASSSEMMYRPTLGRAVMSRKVDRVEKSLIGRDERTYSGSCCLPNIAMYAVGSNKAKQLTAR